MPPVGGWPSGVYRFRNRVNGKVYVGSAKDVRKRRRSHVQELEKGSHCNSYLQAAWNKYGAKAFIFGIVERCPVARLIDREQYWIDFYRAAEREFGYNLCPRAGSTLGIKYSDESKAKISRAKRGLVWSDESKAKLSATLKGHPVSEKALKAMDWTGRKHTEESKLKMAEAARNRSPETLAKMSEAGRKKRLTEEHKRKIALAGIGRKKSPETLLKLSQSLKGKKRSGQALANIQAANAKKLKNGNADI